MKIPWLYIGVGLIVAGVIGILVGLFLLRRERHLGAAKVQFARPSEMDLEPASKADDQWDDPPAPAYTVDTFVIGQRETNPDGTHRQDIISALAVGDHLRLRHEPDGFDPNAIAVVAAEGVIGHLPSGETAKLIPILGETTRASATVSRLVEDDVNQSRVFGVWIHIELWRLRG